MTATNSKFDFIYDKINNTIIEKLQAGKIPWQKPWNCIGAPCNPVTKTRYSGINLLMTMLSDFKSPYYLTANQIKANKGSWSGKGTLIVYWCRKTGSKEVERDGKKETISYLQYLTPKYYYVWNEEQISGIDFSKFKIVQESETALQSWGHIETLEKIIADMPNAPAMFYKGSQACYSPSKDTVYMPEKETFKTLEGYYSTFLHELAHSTGHTTRLNRPELMDSCSFGSHAYSREELTAELSSTYLCAIGGIEKPELMENTTAYIQSWLRQLNNDKKFFYEAAKEAQKVVDYFMKKEAQPETETTEE